MAGNPWRRWAREAAELERSMARDRARLAGLAEVAATRGHIFAGGRPEALAARDIEAQVTAARASLDTAAAALRQAVIRADPYAVRKAVPRRPSASGLPRASAASAQEIQLLRTLGEYGEGVTVGAGSKAVADGLVKRGMLAPGSTPYRFRLTPVGWAALGSAAALLGYEFTRR